MNKTVLAEYSICRWVAEIDKRGKLLIYAQIKPNEADPWVTIPQCCIGLPKSAIENLAKMLNTRHLARVDAFDNEMKLKETK